MILHDQWRVKYDRVRFEQNQEKVKNYHLNKDSGDKKWRKDTTLHYWMRKY